jgi:Fe-S oxidoreductase
VPDIELLAGEDALLIDDELWEQLIELTDGAAGMCFQCGVCTAACPWGLVKGEPLSVRSLMRQAQLGIQGENDSLWLCTTCAQCEAYCPRGVNITAVFRGLRSVAWERRSTEAGLPSLLWSVFWNDNPWSQPPTQRAKWAGEFEIPTFNPVEHEVLLYVGCTSSYDRRNQRIASALVHTLNAAGVKFGYLGEREPCCGEAVMSVGHEKFFQEVALKTLGVFEEAGVSKVVTISPHCYDVFKNHYPKLIEGFQPLHYTQYLSQLVDQDRLQFSRSLDLQITYQDPCYLGRINNEYLAPRSILGAVPGIELREMENCANEGLCCGGGGGRMWLETPQGERFADLRIEQAVKTGANVLVTACPFCVTCLEDSLKVLKVDDLIVLDIAELAAQALNA